MSFVNGNLMEKALELKEKHVRMNFRIIGHGWRKKEWTNFLMSLKKKLLIKIGMLNFMNML